MSLPPQTDFGKRKPAPPAAASPPVKRSHHVALLLTGTLAVGGAGYALTPRQDCEPSSPGMAAPISPQAACGPRGSSSGGGRGGGGSWSRVSLFGGGSAGSSSSGSTSPSGSAETARGGFGGFARAFSAHFSSGG
jgi:hypothetical protein